MTRLLSDMDAAHKQMLRNPVTFTDAIADAVGKAERGAHRHKWQAIAMCAGIARAVRKDFALFEALRSAPCLKHNKKVQKATKKDFKKRVSIAVATRSFHSTEATENRIAVYGYVIGYFAKEDIPVARIADVIKAMKGIDGVYEQMKAKKREDQELQDDGESAASDKTTSGKTEGEASKPDQRASAAPKSAGASGKRKSAADTASDERRTVKAILGTGLVLSMPSPEELDRYLDGSIRRGQRRCLDVVYGGTDADGFHVWEYVYGRDVEAGPSSRKDNDNEADYEDESGNKNAA